MPTHPSHDRLGQLTADVDQLVHPIRIAQHRRTITHPPLLDQLRAAIAQPHHPANTPERHTQPRSRPPANVDAIDTLTAIYVMLAGWHQRLALPHPTRHTDWHKTALRQLAAAAPTIAPSIADQLADDIHHWWHRAAITCGWRTKDLLQLQ